MDMNNIPVLRLDEFDKELQEAWDHQQSFSFASSDGDGDGDQEFFNPDKVSIDQLHGWARKTSTRQDFKIDYLEQWCVKQQEIITPRDDPSLETSVRTEGFEVVDEHNTPVGEMVLSEHLPSEFKEIDYAELYAALRIEKPVREVDVMPGEPLITVESTNNPDICFTGELVAGAAGFSADNKKWMEFDLYKTSFGQFVCQKIEHRENGNHRFSGEVCQNAQEVRAFFGDGQIAQRLYREARMDRVVPPDKSLKTGMSL